MYAAVSADRDFGNAWFFISFICIVTILFVNTFLGIVLANLQHTFAQQRARAQRIKLRDRWRRAQQLHERHQVRALPLSVCIARTCPRADAATTGASGAQRGLSSLCGSWCGHGRWRAPPLGALGLRRRANALPRQRMCLPLLLLLAAVQSECAPT